MREVQTLHDRLLSLFEALPDLRPRQIVVMAPDIDAYAPHVQAVFDAAPAARHIPWSLADRPVQSEAPVVETLLELLDLPVRRLTASEVLGLLEVPAVSRRLGLAADSTARIRTWVAESGIRWGADAAMRAAENLPAQPANTWAAGLARLFLGYAMAPEETFFGDTLSYPDIEGAEAGDLGALQTLVDRLAHWRGQLARPARPADWPGRINALIADFMDPSGDEDETLQAVRRIAAAMGERAAAAGPDVLLSTPVVKAHLQARLAAAGGARRFLLGAVTFCNMVPMRSIPFRVVCLLGLNDTDFPRRQHPPSFDLIARAPEPGDRSRRLDDRYLFLEALLSARDVLYLSYLGADVRDNSDRMPSVVVGELIDYIDGGWSRADGSAPSARLVCRHPLQPFSARLFDGKNPDLFSYDQRWLPTARQTGQDEIAPFVAAALPVIDERRREVDIEDLVGFFRHPARWFLHRRLGIRPGQTDGPPVDDEPFDLAGLARYGVHDALLADLLAGRSARDAARRVRARGLLAHGAMGEAIWSEVVAEIEPVARQVQAARAAAVDPVELDLAIGPFTLRGWLKDLSETGRTAFRPAKLKANDRLRLWIHHLALCAAAPAEVAPESIHIGTDRLLRLAPVAAAAARLEDLLGLWWQGQSTPLPFFPETSLAYAAARHKGLDEAKARQAAQKAWLDEYNGRGDALDPSVELAWRGSRPLEPAFEDIARQVFAPLLQAAGEEKAR
jgi:exodeoxyribonuclease V gamma subunit